MSGIDDVGKYRKEATANAKVVRFPCRTPTMLEDQVMRSVLDYTGFRRLVIETDRRKIPIYEVEE